MTDHVEVRSGAYYDSVSLMQVSRSVSASEGVEAALVAMATELNIDLLVGMGFEQPQAGPNDLVVAVRGVDDAAVQLGLAALEAALAELRAAGSRSGGLGEPPPPLTTRSALRSTEASLAFVSVPGPSAFVEAMDAVEAGTSVMVFSDNVPVDQEIALKQAAAERDVLVMGPDCGTAMVAGAALGFANVVRPGPVGLVAASGTGAQQVMCLLDAAGVGVSHCLGVGGRDMSAAVGGLSTRQALGALAADETTEAVVVVSKPADPQVLEELEGYAATLGKPVYWATLGAGRPDLTAAVEKVLVDVTGSSPTWPIWDPAETPEPVGGSLRGLFCGGTLADEAMVIAAETLGGIRSNIPLSPELALGADLRSDGHVVIDFGDDQLTRGRPHPMIDPQLRLERIAQEAADPTCGVLLLDLVLGHGAHPDPAGDLAAAITSARETAAAAGRRLPVVVSLTGTEGDPQGLSRCAEQLQAAGAAVYLSNAAAARRAVSLIAGPSV